MMFPANLLTGAKYSAFWTSLLQDNYGFYPMKTRSSADKFQRHHKKKYANAVLCTVTQLELLLTWQQSFVYEHWSASKQQPSMSR